jgi:hypothetical protein
MDDAPEPQGEVREVRQDDGPIMPKWVPTLIGIVLVTMAGLAVYTGLRYRDPTLANGIIPLRRPARVASGNGAPGEPGAGASLIFPGDADTPTPNAPSNSKARVAITGTGGAIDSTPHLSARRGMMARIVPNDAMIYVNETPIGPASQLDSPDEVYDFPAAGSYTVRISAPGYRDQQFIVVASESATAEVVTLDVKMVKEKS